MAEIKAFKGLNTVTDPLRLGLEWQTQADNADITSTGQMLRCRGYARSTTATTMRGAYATEDQERLYFVDGTSLYVLHEDFTTTEIASDLTPAPMRFAEVNGQVLCTNGTDYLTILPDHSVRSWGILAPSVPTLAVGSGSLPIGAYQVVTTLIAPDGRESANSDVAVLELTEPGAINIADIQQTAGYATNVYVTACNGTVFYLLQANAGVSVTYNVPPDALGVELPFYGTNAPRGTLPCVFKGQMYIAEAFSVFDYSIVWSSLPLAYHQFDAGQEGIPVPGMVRMLDSCATHLLIGTDREQFAWDGETLTKLADYGVASGFPSARHGDACYWWSLRGLCTGMPFRNVTEGAISVPPGLSSAAVVMQRDGDIRFVVALQRRGTAYNAYSRNSC